MNIKTNNKEYQELKREYLKANAEGKEQFIIDGETILTAFAKLWIEHTEEQKRGRGERIYNPTTDDLKCKNPNCGYEWTARKDKVIACPRCKRRQDI